MIVKRAAFYLVVVFLLASCGCGFFGGWDDTVITNNSDCSVTFKFHQTGEFISVCMCEDETSAPEDD